MKTAGETIVAAFDEASGRLSSRLEGLDDDEYLWEPFPGCWSLRRGEDGNWQLDGEGGGGPPPNPVPFTTIAWRLGHLAGLALGGFTARRFPDWAPEEKSYPSRAADVPAFLEWHYRPWRSALVSLDDAGWRAPLGPDWGPYAEADTVDLALHVLDEVVHHGAEVGVLRDLYQHRGELGRS